MKTTKNIIGDFQSRLGIELLTVPEHLKREAEMIQALFEEMTPPDPHTN